MEVCDVRQTVFQEYQTKARSSCAERSIVNLFAFEETKVMYGRILK